jgi:hypothetical protein
MTKVPKLSFLLKIWFGFLITVLWSSSLYEIGLPPYFVEKMGITIFRSFGLLFLISSSLFFLGKANLFGYTFFRSHRLLLLLYGGYWLIAWAGTLYSPVPERGLSEVLAYFWYTTLALLTIFVLYYFPIKQRKLLFLLIGASTGLVLICFSAINLATGINPEVEPGKFQIAAFSDYNVFTYSLILSILLIFLSTGDTYSNESPVKLFSYIVLLLLVSAIAALSGSRRSVTLYVPVAMFVPLLLLWLRSLRRFISTFVGLTLLSALIVSILGANLINREIINSTIYSNLDQANLRYANLNLTRGLGFLTGEYTLIDNRLELWESSWHIASEYTLLKLLVGAGTRSFFNDPELGIQKYPHNFILSALLEGGIFKLLVLMAFIVVWVRHLLQASRRSSFWLANFLLVSNLIWLLSGLISNEEFFGTKQFLLLFVVYATFWGGTNLKKTQGKKHMYPAEASHV